MGDVQVTVPSGCCTSRHHRRTATSSSPEPPFRPPVQAPSQRPEEARAFENEPSPDESQPPGDGARTQTSTANSNIDRQLIEEILAQNPRSVAEDLRRRIDNLRASEEYDDRDISSGLWKWHNRPDAGPGLLPNLVGDAWKENRAADAALAQIAATSAATTAAESARTAIKECPDCDDYGRLDDLTDCPRHLNFRQSRVS